MNRLWHKLRLYAAWTLAAVTILLGSGFVILYGNAYGYIKSVLWLIAFIVSFGMSVFLLQPIRFAAFALVFGFQRKCWSPLPLTNPLHWLDVGKGCRQAYVNGLLDYFNERKKKLAVYRKQNDAEWAKDCIYYRELISDLLMFCMYMIMLLLIVLGSRDSSMFYSGRFAKDCLVNAKFSDADMQLKDVIDEDTLKQYLRDILAPALHEGLKQKLFLLLLDVLHFTQLLPHLQVLSFSSSFANQIKLFVTYLT